MEFSFENLGTNTYLVYEINETDELDSMSLGMLTNNSIPGFAPASFTQMDMTKYIKYNVSAKVSVNQLFSGPVNKKRLIGVLSGVVDAMLSAEDYMLDPASILLDQDYIFADVTTCETELVCLPILNIQHENQDLAVFFKNILFTTQFDQTENCDHVAQLINYLNTNPVLILGDFKELLHSLSTSNAARPAPVAQPTVAAQPVQQVEVRQAPQPAVQPVVQPVATPAAAPAPKTAPVQPVVAPKVAPVVPGVPPVAPAQPAAATATGEKPMSFFYLMQHYTKENAAIYKAQQEAAKAKGAAPAPAKAAPAKPAAAKAAPGFAVPGQNPSVNIPGQAAPQPAKQTPAGGFAVPGQAPAKQPAVAKPAPQQPQPAKAGVCPTCGKPVAPNQMFCAACGTRCGAAAAPAQPVQAPVVPAPAPVAPQPAISSMPLNFGETTVLSAAMGETTVLGGAMETVKNDPHLIRTKNNERIPLNKPVFRVGKERSYVDYFISDNTAVSRSHANIINHDGEFFVVDTNSTNHTYVNGGMIQSGVETKLSHGTKIKFANEEFEFKMY